MQQFIESSNQILLKEILSKKNQARNIKQLSSLTSSISKPAHTIILLSGNKPPSVPIQMVALFMIGGKFQQVSEQDTDFRFQRGPHVVEREFQIWDSSDEEASNTNEGKLLKITILETDRTCQQGNELVRNEKKTTIRLIYFQYEHKSPPTVFITLVLHKIQEEICKYPQIPSLCQKVYLLLQKQKQNNQSLPSLLSLYNIKQYESSLCYVSLGCKKKNYTRPDYLMLSEEEGQHHLGAPDFIIRGQSGKKDGFGVKELLGCMMGRKFTEGEIQAGKKYLTEVQQQLIRLLTAVRYIKKCTFESKQENIGNYKPLTVAYQGMQLFGQKKHIQSENECQKTHKMLAYKNFVFEMLELISDYAKKINAEQEAHQKSEIYRIKWLNDLFNEIYAKLNILPCISTSELINFKKAYNYLIRELEVLSQISGALKPSIKDFERGLYNPNSEISIEAIKLKIFENLVNLPVEQGMPLMFYIHFSALLNEKCKTLDLSNILNKTQMMGKRTKILSQLPMKRLKSALSWRSSQDIGLQVQSIADFYNSVHQNLKQKTNIKWKQMLPLLQKSAQILKINGFPDLAIEFFKKIRFQTQIQKCAEDVVLKQGRNWNGKGQFYKNLSEYFQGCNRISKAREFMQKAYEADPLNLEYIQRQRQLSTKESMKEPTKQPNQKSDKKLPQGPPNYMKAEKQEDFYREFFFYEMKESFKEELEEACKKCNYFSTISSMKKNSQDNFELSFDLMGF